jgi:hypothetical protein
MSEILKIPGLKSSHRWQFAGPLHHLQPEKPGMVMKCPH